MFQAQKKVELSLDCNTISEYQRNFIEYKTETYPTTQVFLLVIKLFFNEKNCYVSAKYGIDQINEHLLDEQDDDKIKIAVIPRNKSELKAMINSEQNYCVGGIGQLGNSQ